MSTTPRWLLVSVVLGIGLVLAFAVATIGQTTEVICGHGNVLERIAQVVTEHLGAGAIDGPNGSFCTVPSTASWIVSGAVGLAFVALALLVRRLASPADGTPSADRPLH